MGCLVVVELQGRTGLAEDKYVNTFALAEADPGVTVRDNVTAVRDAFIDLYNGTNAALTGSLGDNLSGVIERATNASTIKMYDITGHLDGSPHGSPFAVYSWTIEGSEGTLGHPEEVAICCTLEATFRDLQLVETVDGSDTGTAPDRPRQRYTGRVYTGPWAASLNEGDANGASRPPAILTTGIRQAFVRLGASLDAVDGGSQLSLGVWSRSDRAIRGVEKVRTDDNWDTQRRRGVAPTAVTRSSMADVAPEIELAA